MARPKKEQAGGEPKVIWPRWADTRLVEAIAADLSDGVNETTASERNGLAPSTVRTWLTRLRKALEDIYSEDAESAPMKPMPPFVVAVAPIARASADLLADLQRRAKDGRTTTTRGGDEHWQPDRAAEFLLARLMPQVYGSGVDKAIDAAGPDAGREAAALLAALVAPAAE